MSKTKHEQKTFILGDGWKRNGLAAGRAVEVGRTGAASGSAVAGTLRSAALQRPERLQVKRPLPPRNAVR